MNPRLKTSKKWTTFPKEYVKQIEQVFKANFKKDLKESKLVVEGRIYPEEILLRVGVLEKGRLAQSNFEVSIGHFKDKSAAIEQIYVCIDAAASMMTEYFQNQDDEEGIDFPRHWTEYEFNKQKVYLQFTTENSDLEKEANKLLGVADDSLVVDEEEN